MTYTQRLHLKTVKTIYLSHNFFSKKIDFLTYRFDKKYGSPRVSRNISSYLFGYPCSNKDICTSYEVDLQPGEYVIECWGAGASNGNGAYTKGVIELKNVTKLHLYVGPNYGLFNSAPENATFRSGLKGSGSTDVRLENGSFYSFSSLKSRIMVAASGASGESWEVTYNNGPGGGLASSAVYTSGKATFISYGANQTSSAPLTHIHHVRGTFGVAGYIVNETQDWGAFGGNGYYAGVSVTKFGSGSGGSSFISGHHGCDAIFENSTNFDEIYHSGQSVHFSGKRFIFTEMLDGSQQMPKPVISPVFQTESGHIGDGFVRISLYSRIIFKSCKVHFSLGYTFQIFVFILLEDK